MLMVGLEVSKVGVGGHLGGCCNSDERCWWPGPTGGRRWQEVQEKQRDLRDLRRVNQSVVCCGGWPSSVEKDVRCSPQVSSRSQVEGGIIMDKWGNTRRRLDLRGRRSGSSSFGVE